MLDRCKEKIIEVKDFPKPGIGFKDITPSIVFPPGQRKGKQKKSYVLNHAAFYLGLL